MSDTNRFKNRLIKLKYQLDNRIHAIDKDIRHEGMSADWTEQASERENDEVLESLGNSAEHQIDQINQALHRIDQGEYFKCQRCDEDIPLQRLEALPFCIYCVDCAETIETESPSG